MNHAQEAKKHIEWTKEWQEREGSTDATGLATALLAQTHATLELAEQQRIANLIALLEHAEGDSYKPRLDAIEYALGIGDQS